MFSPANFFKAIFQAGEGLFIRFILAVIVVAILFAFVGYGVAHCST